MLFYGLDRFSVDLDFDLLTVDGVDQSKMLKEVVEIIEKYGKVKEQYVKQHTIFGLLSYGETDRNIKIVINTRPPMPTIREYYELTEYLGTSMFVAKQDFMFASKLVALVDRRRFAVRDVYDVYFFAKQNWQINAEVILYKTGKGVRDYLVDCVAKVEQMKDVDVLQGLGELVSEKQKSWIRMNLKKETIFLLKNYRAALS